jgi:hypothetical protein
MRRTTKLLVAAALGAACAIALNAQTSSRNFIVHDVRVFDGAASQSFTSTTEWKQYALPLSADGKGLQAILFSASTTPGPFAFEIDDVQLVKP